MEKNKKMHEIKEEMHQIGEKKNNKKRISSQCHYIALLINLGEGKIRDLLWEQFIFI